MKTRTLWACEPVAFVMDCGVAPEGCRNSARIWSAFVAAGLRELGIGLELFLGSCGAPRRLASYNAEITRGGPERTARNAHLGDDSARLPGAQACAQSSRGHRFRGANGRGRSRARAPEAEASFRAAPSISAALFPALIARQAASTVASRLAPKRN
jgi:hypothetical protein